MSAENASRVIAFVSYIKPVLEELECETKLELDKTIYKEELIEDIVEFDGFDFGLFAYKEGNNTVVIKKQDKAEAELCRRLYRIMEVDVDKSVGNFDRRIEELKIKALEIVDKYFTESDEVTCKTDYFSDIRKMKENRVVPKAYIQRRLGPYIYNNKKIKESGMSGAEVLNFILTALVKEGKIAQLTDEQNSAFGTTAKLIGVF